MGKAIVEGDYQGGCSFDLASVIANSLTQIHTVYEDSSCGMYGDGCPSYFRTSQTRSFLQNTGILSVLGDAIKQGKPLMECVMREVAENTEN